MSYMLWLNWLSLKVDDKCQSTQDTQVVWQELSWLLVFLTKAPGSQQAVLGRGASSVVQIITQHAVVEPLPTIDPFLPDFLMN